jgi:ABC-type multidrug transport system ATPase subunit
VRFAFSDLVLETKGITRLAALSGHILPGRVTAILGGSGAGKTTFVNALLGKEAASGGSVTVAAVPLSSSEDAGVADGAGEAFAHSNPLYSAAASPDIHAASAARISDNSNAGGGSATPGSVLAAAEVVLSMGELRRALGFVPQVDVLIRELSLRENVLHSALTRLPYSVSRAEAAERADEVLDGLGLTHVADSLVGDESARGVSGGERKRLSIAVELVADPLVLFLDEPTTGLDSTSALSAMKALRRLARNRGITCVCIVHQPRHEILEAFDDLVLLGRGGRPIYLGPRSLALDYLCDALGYELPEECSPSDFFLDVANGRLGLPCGHQLSQTQAPSQAPGSVPLENGANFASGAKDVVAVVEALAIAWRNGGAAWVLKRTESSELHHGERVLASATAAAATTAASSTDEPSTTSWSTQLREQLRPRRGFLAQVQLHAARALRQRLRGTSLALDLTALLLGGVIAGIVLSGGDLLVLGAPPQYSQSCPVTAGRFCT